MIEMEDLLYEAKAKIILEIHEDEGIIGTQLRRRTGLTYSYISGVLKFLEENNIVQVRKKGRCKHLFLTDEGFELARELKKLVEVLD